MLSSGWGGESFEARGRTNDFEKRTRAAAAARAVADQRDTTSDRSPYEAPNGIGMWPRTCTV
jgi:hypothetical protein